MQKNRPEYGNCGSTVIQQTVDVGLPVSIVPIINLGSIKIMCNGDPNIECHNCTGDCGDTGLMITQTVTYNIPIEYCANVTTGNITSECKKNIIESNCTQCHNQG